MWVHLRALRAQGIHFRRQVPRFGFIADFACLKHRIVVEIDGSGHGHHGRAVRDAARDRKFGDAGWIVLRFWNSEVDENLAGVVDAILAAVGSRATPPTGLRPVPPPRSGEGLEPA